MLKGIDLGGLGHSNAMMSTRKGVINLYLTMIKVASNNIGRRTFYNVLINEEFVERLKDRVTTLQAQFNWKKERIDG